jgi:hypothetical protein
MTSAIRATADGKGSLVVGTRSNVNTTRAVVIRTDEQHTPLWTVELGYTAYNNPAQATYGADIVDLGNDQYVLLAALNTAFVNVEAFQNLDYVLVRFSRTTTGTVVHWTKRIGGPFNDVPHLPLPGAEQEPDIAHAIENALQHLILWSQAEKARIQCHLNLQRHKPERRCAICISWPSGSPTFPNDRDRFLKRLLTEEGLPFIRQHFTAPETVHEIILLCLWRSWMLHGQRILAVDLEDVARLPTIAAGSTFPDPEPSTPILFAIKNGTNRPQLVFVEDGRGLDRIVQLSRITEGAYGASMAKGPTSGLPGPRRFIALSIRPLCLDDPSPSSNTPPPPLHVGATGSRPGGGRETAAETTGGQR